MLDRDDGDDSDGDDFDKPGKRTHNKKAGLRECPWY